ncbi:MAG: hypothetical protein LUG13_06805 [Oscillospiraceae bacterium]|nr:hypothetical protein [Oscillospiraceae bacterium]
MNDFTHALISSGPNTIIPDEHNLFGKLIGTWNFEWIGYPGTDRERHAKGEWIFSWVLNGTAVQDIFIVPSRKENAINPQPDAEFGTTLRFFHPADHTWSIFYGSTVAAVRLSAERNGEEIVLTEMTKGDMKWIFSDMTDETFHWKHIKTADNGETWYTHIEIFATRHA